METPAPLAWLQEPQIWALESRFGLPFITQLAAASTAAEATQKASASARDRQRLVEEWEEPPLITSEGVQVLPVRGVITRKATPWKAYAGLPTYDRLAVHLAAAAENPRVKAVAFVFDTPGGSAQGCDALAEEIRHFEKPAVSFIDGLCASAGYYLASQTSRIYADRDALTGSIGTILQHMEFSRMLEAWGVKVTTFRAPENKGQGDPNEPLSKAAAEELQEIVEHFAAAFFGAVGQGRGARLDAVRARDDVGGRVFPAGPAQKVGLIDAAGTLSDAINHAAELAANTK